MAGEKERVDAYLATVDRMEPEIAMIDAGAFYASAAISLKRIADSLDKITARLEGIEDTLDEGLDHFLAAGK